MARYQLTTQDRSKGGKTTASKYDMRQRGRRGLQALADRHFDGNVKKAGRGLSTLGNVTTDPTSNRAFSSLYRLPQSLLAVFWGHCEVDDPDGVAF